MSPWVEERALAFAIHVIRGFSENTSTGCLGASKERVDPRDTKCDGVRRGALLCRRSGVSVYAGFGDDDGPVAVQELTPIVGIAETFGKWQGRCEPLDCFAHVGVVQHGYYGGIWCRAVLLQHRIGGYQCFPGRLTRFRPNFSVYLDYRLQKDAAVHRNDHGRAGLDRQEYNQRRSFEFGSQFCQSLTSRPV